MFSLVRGLVTPSLASNFVRSLSFVQPLSTRFLPALGLSSVRLFAHKMAPLPRVTNLKFVKGKEYDVEALRGKTGFVLEFWATWCGPCRQTIPHLTRMAKELPNVPFIGISSGEDEATVKNFVSKMGNNMDYSVAIDTDGSVQQLMANLSIMGIPSALVVDGKGEIQYQGHPMQPDFIQSVKKHCLAAPAIKKVTQTREQLMAMSVKDLQKILQEHKLPCEGCLEKTDIVDLIDKSCR